MIRLIIIVPVAVLLCSCSSTTRGGGTGPLGALYAQFAAGVAGQTSRLCPDGTQRRQAEVTHRSGKTYYYVEGKVKC